MLRASIAETAIAVHVATERARPESLGAIRVEGLMTIPPFFDDPVRARPFYAHLRELAGRYGLRELSMGMTGDFESTRWLR